MGYVILSGDDMARDNAGLSILPCCILWSFGIPILRLSYLISSYLFLLQTSSIPSAVA